MISGNIIAGKFNVTYILFAQIKLGRSPLNPSGLREKLAIFAAICLISSSFYPIL